MRTIDPSKELRLMLAFFGESRLPACRTVAADVLPDPERQLLDHDGHMTVTLETHYGKPVRLQPYQVHRQGDWYGRKLDLLLHGEERVVMTGIMLFNFDFCGQEIQEEIIAASRPLGRILIENDILRTISATAFLEFESDEPMVARLTGRDANGPAYGRLATIFCDGKPAVDLLEIVSPGGRRGS